MRKSTISAIFLLTFLCFQAQEKVNYQGETCYKHIVEKGNTLYGISKQYVVGIPDLFRLNPDARIGISVGQILFVPIEGVTKKEAKRSPVLKGSVLFHTVQRGETLYSLSKQYKVDINALLEANADIKDANISKGQVIKIPTSQVEVAEALVSPATLDSLLSHDVLPGETLYSISKLYEVTADSIKAVNGGLADGLKAGNSIRIPRYRSGFTPSWTEGTLLDKGKEGRPIISAPMKQLKIALLLPFSLNGSDSIHFAPVQSDIVKMTDIAFEYYRGAKFALEDLKEQGLRARVLVMDVGSAQLDVEKAISKLNSEHVDLVIGPLHRGALKKISNDPRMHAMHFVSPVSKILDAASVDNTISKITSSDEAQMEHLADFLKKERSADRIILINSTRRSIADIFLQKACPKDSAGMPLPGSLKVSELNWSRYLESSLEAALSTSVPNVIIFLTSDRSTVTEFVSKLAMGQFKKYDITLVGLEEWIGYDNLDTDLLAKLKFTVSASKFLDVNTQNYMDFMQRYYITYNTIPGPDGYAFQAYDITMFYVEGLMRQGLYFLDDQSEWKKEGLQIGFDMHPLGQGTYENMYSVIIQNQGQDFKVLDKH